MREVCRQRITVEAPVLWSCETPKLYTCRLVLKAEGEVLDEAEEVFGIRTISLECKERDCVSIKRK